MNILFYRFNNIYEPDVISAFQGFGLHVIEERAQMDNPSFQPTDAVDLVAGHILNARKCQQPLLFVFSINFIPALSEVCEKTNTLYVCWSVDCPVVELFHKSICNKHNRIFLFDKAQYSRFHPYNPECIFYLPLGANVNRVDQTIASITAEERQKFTTDISFVGSLYSEMNPLRKLLNTDEYLKGYVDGIVEAQLQLYGFNFIEEALTDSFIERLKNGKPSTSNPDFVEPIDRYVAAHSYIGMELAQEERIRTLSMLSKDFHVDLYTKSDTAALPAIHVRGAAHSFKETPKIYHLSKINLNMTMRPIQTGLPLRIFDIMGAGGFLMTNYQEEIPDFFEIGKDLEVYSSLDELRDKCAHYLAHDEERRAIAQSGYEKVKSMHTVQLRVAQIVSTIMGTL